MPSPFAIAGIIHVPWDETNRRHTFRFELMDLDGQAVKVQTQNGVEPLWFEGQFEVGRPPGHRNGAPVPFPFAFNGSPVPLEPGSHFVWNLSVNGRTASDWRLAFSTRSAAQSDAA